MSNFFLVFMVIGLIFGFFFPRKLPFFWAMINCLQLMTHVPLFNVNFPANAAYFYSKMLSASVFDIFPADKLNKDIYSFDKEKVFSPNFEVMGYKNLDYLSNMSSMFIHGCIIGGIMLGTYIAYLFLNYLKVGLGFYHKHKHNIYINLPIRYFIEAYLVMAISALLNFEHLSTSGTGEVMGSMLSILTFMLIVTAPPAIFSLLLLKQNKLRP